MSKENEQHSLAKLGDRSVSRYGEDAGLTPLQHRQLTKILKGYLKENNLSESYENITKALVVIRGVIKEALMALSGRDEIQPRDSLDMAFNLYYPRRQKLVKEARIVVSDNAENGTVARLALKQDSLSQVILLLNRQQFEPDLAKLAEFLEECRFRESVFEQVVAFSRALVEKSIEGSSEVWLDKKQQLQLVRNLIFATITYEELRCLVSFEEIIENASWFRSQVEGRQEEWAATLSVWFGMSKERGLGYISDLIRQVYKAVEGLGLLNTDEETISYEALATQIKRVLPNFLVENPMDQVSSLSLDPNAGESSVWSDGNSAQLLINGSKYRVPKPEAVRSLAWQESVENPSLAVNLRLGASRVEILLREVAVGAEREVNQEAQAKVEHLKEESARFRAGLEIKNYPDRFVYADDQICDLTRGYFNALGAELSFIKRLFPVRERLLELGFEMFGKYARQESLAIGKGDMESLRRIYVFSDYLKTEGMVLIRRWEQRLRKVGNFVALTDVFFHLAKERDIRGSLFQYDSAGFDLTAAEILMLRADLWCAENDSRGIFVKIEQKRQFYIESLNAARLELASVVNSHFSLQLDGFGAMVWMSKNFDLIKDLATLAELKDIYERCLSLGMMMSDFDGQVGVQILDRRSDMYKRWQSSATLALSSLRGDRDIVSYHSFTRDQAKQKRAVTDIGKVLSNKQYGQMRAILGGLLGLVPYDIDKGLGYSYKNLAHGELIYDGLPLNKDKNYTRKDDRMAVARELVWHFGQYGINVGVENMSNYINKQAADRLRSSYPLLVSIYRLSFDVVRRIETTRLRMTQQGRLRILEENPANYIASLEDKISREIAQLANSDSLVKKRLESRVNQLKSMGLIREIDRTG